MGNASFNIQNYPSTSAHLIKTETTTPTPPVEGRKLVGQVYVLAESSASLLHAANPTPLHSSTTMYIGRLEMVCWFIREQALTKPIHPIQTKVPHLILLSLWQHERFLNNFISPVESQHLLSNRCIGEIMLQPCVARCPQNLTDAPSTLTRYPA